MKSMILQSFSKKWVASFYIVMRNGAKTVVAWGSLTDPEKKMARQVGYPENFMDDRPVLKALLPECEFSVQSLVGPLVDKEDNWFEKRMEDSVAKGYKLFPWIAPAGAKMGGKNAPIYFLSKENLVDNWCKEHHIDLLKINVAKRFERIKKILGRWEKFSPKPTVKFIEDEHTRDGIAYAKASWATKADVRPGTKMSGIFKDVIMIVPDTDWKYGKADLAIHKDGNKLGVTIKVARQEAGYDPEQLAERRFSQNLVRYISEEGEVQYGRDPNFRLDVLAWFNHLPTPNLSMINRMLADSKDMDVIETFFGYIDKEGKKQLNGSGKRLVAGASINEPDIYIEFQGIAQKYILNRLLTVKASGVFGTAVPLMMLPVTKEDWSLVHEAVVIGYSGGIPMRCKVAVKDNLIYVDEETWMAAGRDFDGDLAFVFPIDLFNPESIVDLKWLKDHFKLPEKVSGEDTRNDVQVFLDILAASRGCGSIYNMGKIIVDACRSLAWSKGDLMKLDAKIMAEFVQPYIDGFKYHRMTEAPKLKELVTKLGLDPDVLKAAYRAQMFFYALRGRGDITIGDLVYPRLAGLKQMALEAKPQSLGFYERLVAKFRDLDVKVELLAKQVQN